MIYIKMGDLGLVMFPARNGIEKVIDQCFNTFMVCVNCPFTDFVSTVVLYVCFNKWNVTPWDSSSFKCHGLQLCLIFVKGCVCVCLWCATNMYSCMRVCVCARARTCVCVCVCVCMHVQVWVCVWCCWSCKSLNDPFIWYIRGFF